jgi:hypothetical protein
MDSTNSVITNFTIQISEGGHTELEVSLYTSSKPQSYYGEVVSPLNSTKYFKESISCGGVIDSYETLEVYARKVSAETYEFDTCGKTIIAVGSRLYPSGVSDEIIRGSFAYTPNGSVIKNLKISDASGSIKLNDLLPVEFPSEDLTPTKVRFNCPVDHPYLKVPVIVYSPLVSNDASYKLYYKCSPYQGLLNSNTPNTGEFIKRGKAIVTTKGSDVSPNAGDRYLNMIGRLPSVNDDSILYGNQNIGYQGYDGSYVELTLRGMATDFMQSHPKDFSLGKTLTPSGRGVLGAVLSEGLNPYLPQEDKILLQYGVASEGIICKKVTQFYLMRSCVSEEYFDSYRTGKVYLVAVSAKCEGTNIALDGSGEDSDSIAVDMFELVGRPLIK